MPPDMSVFQSIQDVTLAKVTSARYGCSTDWKIVIKANFWEANIWFMT